MFSVIKGKQFLYPALWDKPLSYTSNRIKKNPGHDWRQKLLNVMRFCRFSEVPTEILQLCAFSNLY